MRLIDLSGKRFGLLEVIRFDGNYIRQGNKNRRSWWVCKCDCGSETIVNGQSLVGGKTQSCGCSKQYALGAPRDAVVTGMSRTPEYTAWIRMRRSCYDTDYKDYHRYGGRGIRVFDEWLHDFLCFLAHIGNRPSPTHSVDRFPDNNGNYEPGNVRWATKIEQGRNRRTCVTLYHDGLSLTLIEWSEKTGIPYQILKSRRRLKWTVERMLTEPVKTPSTITHEGESLTLSQWSSLLNISVASLEARISAGWSIEKTLTTPLRPLRRTAR